MKTLITILCALTIVAGIFLSTTYANRNIKTDKDFTETYRQHGDAIIPEATSFVAFVDPCESNAYQQPTGVLPPRATTSTPPVAYAPGQPLRPAAIKQPVPQSNTPSNPYAQSFPVTKNPSPQPQNLRAPTTSFGPVTATNGQPRLQSSLNVTSTPSGFGTSRQVAFAGKLPSHNASKSRPWPANAKNVKSLVRTQYSLPAGAAESIVEFCSADGNECIETKIKTDEKSALVTLQVTTDETTQRAIANFLAAVYPQSRLDKIKKSSTAKEPALPVVEQTLLKNPHGPQEPLLLPDPSPSLGTPPQISGTVEEEDSTRE